MVGSFNRLAALERAHELLIEALDGHNVEVIEDRVERLKVAIAEVRSFGAWHETSEVRETAQRIMKLAEAARTRVNFLTDMNRQRIDVLHSVRNEGRVLLYAQPGRTAA